MSRMPSAASSIASLRDAREQLAQALAPLLSGRVDMDGPDPDLSRVVDGVECLVGRAETACATWRRQVPVALAAELVLVGMFLVNQGRAVNRLRTLHSESLPIIHLWRTLMGAESAFLRNMVGWLPKGMDIQRAREELEAQ